MVVSSVEKDTRDMSIEKEFEQYCASVLPIIEQRMKKWINDSELENKEVYHYAISGGKKVRSTLCMMVSDALGGDRHKTLDCATAVEYTHCASLAHDDILDHDDYRRGKESLKKKYGSATAILAGDAFFPLAAQCLVKHDSKFVTEITNTWIRLIKGVTMEMSRIEMPGELVYKSMIESKTASLFRLSAALGAESAGGTEMQVHELSRYGKMCGIAFQLEDDLGDYVDSEKSGIMQGDLKNKMITFPIIKLAQFDAKLRDVVKGFSRGEVSSEKMLALVKDYDTVRFCREEIDKYLRRCDETISMLDLKEPFKSFLRLYPVYIIARLRNEEPTSIISHRTE